VVLFNYAIREITAKIVYYGPGLCGKTTNLQFLHEKLDAGARGKLLSLATDGDRTLFFDFLPIEAGTINGYKVRFQLYTVPGQVHYNATRKLVLKGVDAVVFVADSQLSMVERNRESFENLAENLAENGYEIGRVPVVIQLNKRDLPNIASAGELVASMGVQALPVLEAVASRGDGVFDTLKAVVKLTLGRLRAQFEAESAGRKEREAPVAPPPPPPSVFAPAPVAPGVDQTPAPPPEEYEPFEEFDLEDYCEPPVAPEPPGTVEVPDEPMIAEEPLPGDALVPEGLPEYDFPEGDVGTGDQSVGFDEYPAEEEVPSAAAPAEEWQPHGDSREPPAWAQAIFGELQELREENRALRAALQGFAGVLERQIDVLREGREELVRSVGDVGAVDDVAAGDAAENDTGEDVT